VKRFRAAALVLLAATGALAAGCGGRPTLSQWASSSGVVGLDSTVAGDVHDIVGATKAHRPALEITTICDALYSDANQAYDSVLPTPDQQITNALSQAYVDLVNGAQDCSTSVGGSNAAAIAHAYEELNTGNALLSNATSDLASLGVT
jgi:hypothetical protein